MSKRIVALILALLVAFSLAACGQGGGDADVDDGDDGDGVETPDPNTDPEPEPEPKPTVINPATGLYMDVSVTETPRPVAIMINNFKKATPQAGITGADLYIEALAEGSITRIMPVYFDYAGIPEIGTVRSARDYFIDYAQPLDAVFIHYGGSPEAYRQIKARPITDLDGINATVEKTLYWRDSVRRKTAGYEHSVLTSGEKIVATLEARSIRDVYEGDDILFKFSALGVSYDGSPASEVVMSHNSSFEPVFTYDEESGNYLRSQHRNPHIDSNDGAQIAVKNVIILFTSVKVIAGDEAGRREVATSGSGEGYYASDGVVIPIRWSKKDKASWIKLEDESGRELIINCGKSWIGILGTGRKSYVTFGSSESE